MLLPASSAAFPPCHPCTDRHVASVITEAVVYKQKSVHNIAAPDDHTLASVSNKAMCVREQ